MQTEQAYNEALTAVAMGVERDILSDILHEKFDRISLTNMDRILNEALRDALAQGVEKEDIDPSWFDR